MRTGDLFREVFYPLMVASLIGTVWCVAKFMPGGDSVPQKLYPPLNPALSRRALMADDSVALNPTTAPVRVSSINAGDP